MLVACAGESLVICAKVLGNHPKPHSFEPPSPQAIDTTVIEQPIPEPKARNLATFGFYLAQVSKLEAGGLI